MQHLWGIGHLAVIVLHLLCMDLVPYLNAVEWQYVMVESSGPGDRMWVPFSKRWRHSTKAWQRSGILNISAALSRLRHRDGLEAR